MFILETSSENFLNDVWLLNNRRRATETFDQSNKLQEVTEFVE